MPHRRFHPAFGRLNQQIDFGIVFQRRRNSANQHQVGIFALNLVAVIGHLQIDSRQPALRAKAANRLQ